MKLFKCIKAYYAGIVAGNDLDRKVLPFQVYNYNKDEIKWFIKGLLKCTIKIDDSVYYKHPSVVYLTNIEKVLKDNGVNTEFICEEYFKCIRITK